MRIILPLPHRTISKEIFEFTGRVFLSTDDELGKLNLTDNGLFARDVFVMTECLSRGMPVAGVIGGGYHRDRRVLGRRHSILHRAAETVWEQQSIASKSWA